VRLRLQWAHVQRDAGARVQVGAEGTQQLPAAAACACCLLLLPAAAGGSSSCCRWFQQLHRKCCAGALGLLAGLRLPPHPAGCAQPQLLTAAAGTTIALEAEPQHSAHHARPSPPPRRFTEQATALMTCRELGPWSCECHKQCWALECGLLNNGTEHCAHRVVDNFGPCWRWPGLAPEKQLSAVPAPDDGKVGWPGCRPGAGEGRGGQGPACLPAMAGTPKVEMHTCWGGASPNTAAAHPATHAPAAPPTPCRWCTTHHGMWMIRGSLWRR
jgi:hypothetical protein